MRSKAYNVSDQPVPVKKRSMGDVYRARDGRLDRPVALKLLRQQARDADEAGSAVIEEGRLMARVRHPNVVTVYGAERVEGRVGLWMELVDGRTLEEELRQRGPLPWTEVCRIGSELSQALAAVHRAGLLHRDLKAQNVLRETSGRVVLADFGAGRILSHDDDDHVDAMATGWRSAGRWGRVASSFESSTVMARGRVC